MDVIFIKECLKELQAIEDDALLSGLLNEIIGGIPLHRSLDKTVMESIIEHRKETLSLTNT